MTIELTAVGGYNEVGRQSTAIKVDQDVVIVDLGLHLDHYINYTKDEEEDLNTTSQRGLRKAGAIPDWTSIKDWKKNVRAIVLTHAHLDHIGAVPYLAHIFDCPIYGSPFTVALLNKLIDDKRGIEVENEIVPIEDKVQITDKITAEFIKTTHSTADARQIALHTPYGVVFIDNDYKIDHHPTLGDEPDVEALKRISKNVVAHVSECLYAPAREKAPSESVARQMLQEVLLEEGFEGRTVFVSTFSSHIARLKTIMEIGKAMDRKVVFFGRSMSKYLEAAQEAGIISIPKHVERKKYGSQIRKFLKKHDHDDLSEYLLVCTGHMGEPKAALSKLAGGKYPFRFKPDDVVVFSSRVIPVPHIVANREDLQRKLKDQHVRIYDNVHVSGHAKMADIRWLFDTLQADQVIPNHGVPEMTEACIDIAREAGYTPERIHNLREGDRITIVE